MNLFSKIDFFNKPVYWARPSQIFSRLMHKPAGIADVKVAWGTTIRCNTQEQIGRSILHQGIYDLVVSEAICRLVRPGATAVDVGANIGHMTGLMAKRAGPTGRVISFEPSSRILKTLNENVAQWNKNPKFAEISINECAVSEREGRRRLYYSSSLFSSNEGTASLSSVPGSDPSTRDSEEVSTTALDSALSDVKGKISVLKIDAEGHELDVLKGASVCLAREQIVHIIFEDHEPYRSPVHRFLETRGYTVYRLARSPVRAMAVAPNDRSPYPEDVMPNFLATIEPLAAARAFTHWGWSALRP